MKDIRRFGLILTYGALIVFSILTLIPILWLIVGSIKTNEDFFGYLLLPGGDGLFGVAWDRLTLKNYANLFTTLNFGNNIMNSIFLSSVSSLLGTFTAALGGYPHKKSQEKLKKLAYYAKEKENRLFGGVFGLDTPNYTLGLVMIRNVQWKSNKYFIHSGCGVVNSSQPEKELKEIINKRESIESMFS